MNGVDIDEFKKAFN